MAAESYRTVMPAYYDVVLTTKLTRDNDSEGMIDIIKNSRSYPLQLKTFTFNLFTPFVTGQKNNMTSFYKSNEKRGMQELEVIAEAYSTWYQKYTAPFVRIIRTGGAVFLSKRLPAEIIVKI